MRKKVEVYFVIYLTALISILAIEGELKRYKKNQEYILNKIAEDKAQSLVSIATNDNSDGKKVKLILGISGDFIFSKGKKEAIFTNEKGEKYITDIIEKKGGDKYIVEMNKEEFDHNKLPHDIVLSFNIIPRITYKTRQIWLKDYKDIKIVNKLVDLIDNKELSVKRKLGLSIIPEPGVASSFKLKGDKRIVAFEGIKWTHKVIPSGIENNKDYNVKINSSNRTVKVIKNPEDDEFVVTGISREDETIKLIAVRNSDGWKATYSLDVTIKEPRFETVPPAPTEICINEPFSFDGTLQNIEPFRIQLMLRGTYYPNGKLIDNSFVEFKGFDLPGILIIDVLIDGEPEPVKSYTISVIQPDKPEVKFFSKEGNVITFVIKTFCKGNKVKKFVKTKGIKNYKELKNEYKDYGSYSETYYQITLKEPQNNKRDIIIKYHVEDSFGNITKVMKKFSYNW